MLFHGVLCDAPANLLRQFNGQVPAVSAANGWNVRACQFDTATYYFTLVIIMTVMTTEFQVRSWEKD